MNKKKFLNAVFSILTLTSTVTPSAYKVTSITEIYNQGSQTPTFGNALQVDYIKTKGNSALTEIGMRQHYNLGSQIHKDYKSLFKSIEPEDYQVYSSPEPKSIMSAISHNLGLFRRLDSSPLEKELEVERPSRPLWKVGGKRPRFDVRQLSNFERDRVVVPVVSQEGWNDRMFFSKLRKVCYGKFKEEEMVYEGIEKVYGPLLEEQFKTLQGYGLSGDYFVESKKVNNFFNIFSGKKSGRKGKLLSKVELVQGWSLRVAALWASTVQSYKSYFGFNPKKLTDDDMDLLNRMESSYQYSNFQTDESRKFYTTKIFQKIKENYEEITNYGLGLKYLGFSASTNTIAAILTGFGEVDQVCNFEILTQNSTIRKCQLSPPAASNIVIELSRRKEEKHQIHPMLFVRVFYNKKKIQFCPTQEEYCPLEQFHKFIEKYFILENLSAECKNDHAVEMPSYHYYLAIGLLILMILYFRFEVVEDYEMRIKNQRKNDYTHGVEMF